jgi:hypothetical protein
MNMAQVLSAHDMVIEVGSERDGHAPMYDGDGEFVCYVPNNTTPEALNAMLQLANKRWEQGRLCGYGEAQAAIRKAIGV